MFLSVTSREFGHHGTYLVLDFIFESVFLLSSLMKKKKKKKDYRDFKLDAFFSVTIIYVSKVLLQQQCLIITFRRMKYLKKNR